MIDRRRRRLVAQGIAAAAAHAMVGPAGAAAVANWPAGPIRLVVVYPPGGLSDGIARRIAELLSRRFRVPVVVENRPGGGGALGLAAVARGAPDGSILGYSATSPLTIPAVDSAQEAQEAATAKPVIGLMRTPVLVVGTRAFEGQDWNDVLGIARRSPDRLRWATSGYATVGHFVLHQVGVEAGVRIVHIPYKGGAQQINDALAGHFELLSTNVAPAQLQHLRERRLKALAVGAPARLAMLPDVPTLAELGMPRANLTSHFGVFAPRDTPAELVDRINAAIAAVLGESELRGQMTAAGNFPDGAPVAVFARQIAQDRAQHQAVLSGGGMRPP